MMRSRPFRLAAILLFLVAGVVAMRPLIRAGTGDPADAELADVPAPPREIVYDTLGRGESLAEVMSRHGLGGPEIHEITRLIHDYKLPRTLRPGAVMRFSGAPGAVPDRVNLQMNPDSILRFTASDSQWSARLQVVPLIVDTLRLSGVIESSLWLAHLGGDIGRLDEGGFEEMVYDLADVFAWKIDFTRDIQKGDAFRVVLEREVRPNGSVKSRRFLAIELHNRGRVLQAFPFPRENGRIAWFDAEGGALRGAFMRYPVPYRITSGFTNRRFHPILKRYRAHQGIDYGAPRGTRVQATAAGTVTRAGWWSAYGRAVEIRHAGGIRTRYAHLSAIAPGIRAGRHVDQGDVIGRVGSTGLATAAHLHYEFLQGGRHRNPMTVSLPAEPALEAAHLPEFQRRREAALPLLAGVPIPEMPEPVAAR
jgi:murein DD-endopeptidase MepM/ murein hydrolase activator NlpD